MSHPDTTAPLVDTAPGTVTGDVGEGKLVVFCAPSGAGKTTLVKHLLSVMGERLMFSVSATTRERRPNEVDGRDYYFLGREQFEARIASGDLLEHEEVYSGTLYGTLYSELERIFGMGCHVIFDVDVQGGKHIKQLMGERCLAVFVKPPSFEVLEQRLRSRSTETEEQIIRRLAKASGELLEEGGFDYVLLNEDLAKAKAEAEAVVGAFLEGARLPLKAPAH